MDKEAVFETVKRHIVEILPEVQQEDILPEIGLRDLGANSIDRVEVATCSMEELGIRVSSRRLAEVETIGELVIALHEQATHAK